MSHQYSCSACGFQVQSDNEDEIVDHVQEHADKMHDMSVSEADVRDGIDQV